MEGKTENIQFENSPIFPEKSFMFKKYKYIDKS